VTEASKRTRSLPIWLYLAVAALVTYAIDQLTKVWALDALGDGHTVPLLGKALQLKLVHNSGAAFSIGSSMTWIFTVLAVAVVIGVIVVARQVKSRAWAVTLGLLLGGAIGNLTDRLVRPVSLGGPHKIGQGAVVDFIAYSHFFVGNVADIAIVGAMILMIIGVLRGTPLSGTKADAASAASAAPSTPAEDSVHLEPGEPAPADPASPGRSTQSLSAAAPKESGPPAAPEPARSSVPEPRHPGIRAANVRGPVSLPESHPQAPSPATPSPPVLPPRPVTEEPAPNPAPDVPMTRRAMREARAATEHAAQDSASDAPKVGE
jgi:signal peptidase II